MSACDVDFTVIQYCFCSGCNLCIVAMGMRTMLSSGFEPLPKAALRWASTPITWNNSPAMFIFGFREPAPANDLQVVSLHGSGQVAVEDGVFGFASLVFHGEGSRAELRQHDAQGCGRCLHMRQVTHGQRIVEGQLFAGQHLGGWPAEGERRKVVGEDLVGAHVLQHALDISCLLYT